MNEIRPVVLSGGSGTRLWPLSGSAKPKQFLDLFGAGSLFEQTITRLAAIPRATDPIVVTGESFLEVTLDAVSGLNSTVLVEPAGRNTTAAIIAAAMVTSEDQILVVSPADHLIPGTGSFVAAATEAIQICNDGHIVTLGVVPETPETGYGYIEKGDPLGQGFRIQRFLEKPSQEDAVRMIAEPNFLWNAGLFVATSRAILEQAARYCPEIAAAVDESIRNSSSTSIGGQEVVRLSHGFLEAESVPFDKAIMEKTDEGVVVPLNAGWSDIGSWDAMWKASAKDEAGNTITGDVELIDVERSYVTAATQPIAVIGLDDVVVVETGSGILVTRRDKSQEVREAVSRLEAKGWSGDSKE